VKRFKNGKFVKEAGRLCRDPYTVYCLGLTEWGHRGCCECAEYNAGEREHVGECNPYLLPKEIAELKVWWKENNMGEWGEDDSLLRPKMKKRGHK